VAEMWPARFVSLQLLSARQRLRGLAESKVTSYAHGLPEELARQAHLRHLMTMQCVLGMTNHLAREMNERVAQMKAQTAQAVN
jgi:hypothetical protein